MKSAKRVCLNSKEAVEGCGEKGTTIPHPSPVHQRLVLILEGCIHRFRLLSPILVPLSLCSHCSSSSGRSELELEGKSGEVEVASRCRSELGASSDSPSSIVL